MGKVGSLSVYSSLKKKMWQHAIFHIHTLDNNEVERVNRQLQDKGLFPDSRNPVPLIHKYFSRRQVKIITLVRNPIERNVSAFFDAFQFLVGVKKKDFIGSIADLENNYHQTFLHEYPIFWFQNQFYKCTGINIFSYPFNPEKGYLTIAKDTVSVLLVRSDLPDFRKENLISEFCSIQDFELTNTNLNTSSLYQKFKNNIKFSKKYLEDIYNSDLAVHFFSVQERNDNIEKWIKKDA
ncbi:putative capsular polysaccharide synthesis family protein [Gilvirhabdus luticola]|nr:putative capsular polysaccharide synthesis family protein [Yeosuana sp. MJ-SS3]